MLQRLDNLKENHKVGGNSHTLEGEMTIQNGHLVAAAGGPAVAPGDGEGAPGQLPPGAPPPGACPGQPETCQ